MGSSLPKSPLGDDQKLEAISLIWLDGSVNATAENIDVQQQLRGLVNHFKTFESSDDCLHYIRKSVKPNQIILIVSGRLGREIVPRIHRLIQVRCIYVYCMNKEKNEKWAKKFPKIKGVIVNLQDLVGQIRSDRTRPSLCENEEFFSFNIYTESSPTEQSGVTTNNPFLHFQLLIDCLLRVKANPTDLKQLISFCRDIYHGNSANLSIIDEFEQHYTSERALRWYTRDSFISRLLNKALHTQTVDLLYLLRFFLQDLREQLELNKCTSSIRVYRAQSLSDGDIELFKKSVGDLISINSFLSTDLNYQKASKALTDSNKLKGVLFDIDADPSSIEMKSFGSIDQEDEILFMPGSVFRINEITQQADQSLIIRMILCSDNDQQLQTILKSVQSDDKNREASSLLFGDVLWKMGKLTEAEKYYQRLLIESPDNDDYQISECYYALGNLAMEKNDDDASLEWYQKALEIKRRTLIENDPSLADSYNSLADLDRKKGNITQALALYNKALNIWTQAYGDDHPKIGMCLNNIGCIYGEEKDFQKSLEYQQRALEIMQKHFPPTHLCLGQAHNNIGSVYRYLGDYELALEHYQTSMAIKSKSFSWKHPSMASVYSNIANVYEEMNSLKEALEYYEKAASIYRQRFPPTHPEYIRITEDLRRISSKLKQ